MGLYDRFRHRAGARGDPTLLRQVGTRADPASVYGHLVDRMPEPGDLIEAFSPQLSRCFRMVQSRQLQADHCDEPPAWKGIWVDVKGRSWYVEACAKHAPKVTSGPADGF